MSDGEQQPQEDALFVVATYREIAERWGLKTNDHARMKAKRAGWQMVPQNHPGDAVRVLVPRTEWDAAQAVQRRPNKDGVPQGTVPPNALIVEALKERLEGEQNRRREAEQEAAQAAALRHQVARLEGERDGLKVALAVAQEAAARADQRATEAESRAVATGQAAQDAAVMGAQQIAQAEALGHEMERRALVAEKEAAEAKLALARWQGRPWWRRLLMPGE
ncbi:hypothetical protein NON00_22950 [Roseomonas sp. GC11]|uniref:hypothetical protein n=1 Tax=Roseomonas sp. GC11 TaxID=2950546 RepID=UPI00210DE9C0|nr:hypothetical protein [Roseomonas sp. GC11]MCQ4162768.1 hypothetical protein [Roseomonas sp. GC11]